MAVVDSYSETTGDTDLYAEGSTYGRGQSFTGDGSTISSCKFYIKRRAGGGTGNLYAKVYGHTGTFGSSSTGTGATLATSGAVDVTTVSNAAYNLVEFTFSGADQITLTNGTKYVIFLNTQGVSGFTVTVRADTSSPTHAGNTCEIYNGSWYAGGGDLCFYVYGSGAAGTPITIFRHHYVNQGIQ